MVEKPEIPCCCTFNHATWGYFAILVMLKPTLNVLYRTIKVVSFISPRRARPSLAATVTVSTPLAKLDFKFTKTLNFQGFYRYILLFFKKYSLFSKKNLYFCACVSAIVIRDRELRPWIELNSLHLKLKLWPIWLAIIRR